MMEAVLAAVISSSLLLARVVPSCLMLPNELSWSILP